MNPRRPHALYRFFDAAGALLYIGITWDIADRFPRHALDKPWWSDIANITVETYPDRAAVLEAERLAIKAESPLYNIVHAERQLEPAPYVSRVPDGPRWLKLARDVPELNLTRWWIETAVEDYLYCAVHYDAGRICGNDLWYGSGDVARHLLGDMSIKRLTEAVAGWNAGEKIWPDESSSDWLPPAPLSLTDEPSGVLSMTWEAPRDVYRDADEVRFVLRAIREGWNPSAHLLTTTAYDTVYERFHTLMPDCENCSCSGEVS